jgi:apolipoprotein N-acyltransferase
VIQIADLAGPYGIGMLVASVNAGAAALLTPALRGRRPWLSAAVIGTAVVAALIYGERRLVSSSPTGARQQSQSSRAVRRRPIRCNAVPDSHAMSS